MSFILDGDKNYNFFLVRKNGKQEKKKQKQKRFIMRYRI